MFGILLVLSREAQRQKNSVLPVGVSNTRHPASFHTVLPLVSKVIIWNLKVLTKCNGRMTKALFKLTANPLNSLSKQLS